MYNIDFSIGLTHPVSVELQYTLRTEVNYRTCHGYKVYGMFSEHAVFQQCSTFHEVTMYILHHWKQSSHNSINSTYHLAHIKWTRIQPSTVNPIECSGSHCVVVGWLSLVEFFSCLKLSLNVFVYVFGLQRVTWVRKMWVTCLSVSCATWETSRHQSSLPVSTLTFKLLSHCSSRSYSSQQVSLISWHLYWLNNQFL